MQTISVSVVLENQSKILLSEYWNRLALDSIADNLEVHAKRDVAFKVLFVRIYYHAVRNAKVLLVRAGHLFFFFNKILILRFKSFKAI